MTKRAILAVLTAVGATLTQAGGAVSFERDVAYYESAPDDYAAVRCKLDVRWPTGITGFPTVVWLHGGGLTGGGRHFIGISDKIAQVAVNYRLMGKEGLRDGERCIEDAAAAVAWTFRNIGRFGGDTNRIYLSGMSAGGYLTMMVGMAPKYLAKWGLKPTDLAGIAPVSGQATKHFAVRKYAGDADPQYQPKIDDLAPLRWVGKDLPPIADICGEPPWEWPARSEENRLLVASCTALGHPKAQFLMVPAADHGRAFTAGVPYVEMFVQGQLPRNLKK